MKNEPEFPCSLTLRCTISGRENTFVDPEYIKKRIEKAGGLDKLRDGYVCRAAKIAAKTKVTEVAQAADHEFPSMAHGAEIVTRTDGVRLLHRFFPATKTSPCCHVYQQI